jgi:hypothetical protein
MSTNKCQSTDCKQLSKFGIKPWLSGDNTLVPKLDITSLALKIIHGRFLTAEANAMNISPEAPSGLCRWVQFPSKYNYHDKGERPLMGR